MSNSEPFRSQSKRYCWYLHLNEPTVANKTSMLVSCFIAAVIVMNLVEVVIGSIPRYGLHMRDWYWVTSQLLIAFFGVEYALRIWAAAEAPHEGGLTVWQKRKSYIFSPMGLVDLFSFLPFLLFFIIPQQELSDLKVLKLFAMARLFKLTRYSSSLNLVFRVFQENKRILMAAFMVIMALMFVAAAGAYIFEKEAQPVAFGSIPDAMWWALVTLTTVGYGDVTPITVGGKFFGAIVIICGVGVAAMPAGIFASSFVQLMKEQERQRRKERRGKLLKNAKEASLHLELSRSEQREVDYLIKEFGLTLDQAVGVVTHFRH